MGPWHFFRRPSHAARGLSADSQFAPIVPGLPTASFRLHRRLTSGTVSERRVDNETTKCPEPLCPATGVTCAGETCFVSWVSITSPSSLLRALAPIPLSHLSFGLGLVPGVFAGCHQPRLLTGSSRRYSANLSLVAWSPTTAVPSGARACYFPDVIGLPQRGVSWLPAFIHERDFSWAPFRGCRHSVMFKPPSLFASQVAPTATAVP